MAVLRITTAAVLLVSVALPPQQAHAHEESWSGLVSDNVIPDDDVIIRDHKEGKKSDEWKEQMTINKNMNDTELPHDEKLHTTTARALVSEVATSDNHSEIDDGTPRQFSSGGVQPDTHIATEPQARWIVESRDAPFYYPPVVEQLCVVPCSPLGYRTLSHGHHQQSGHVPQSDHVPLSANIPPSVHIPQQYVHIPPSVHVPPYFNIPPSVHVPSSGHIPPYVHMQPSVHVPPSGHIPQYVHMQPSVHVPPSGHIPPYVHMQPSVHIPPSVQFHPHHEGGLIFGGVGHATSSNSYGGGSHVYVQEPLKHLEISETTPQKYFHTSLILKAPEDTVLYGEPLPFGLHHAEKQKFNLERATYF